MKETIFGTDIDTSIGIIDYLGSIYSKEELDLVLRGKENYLPIPSIEDLPERAIVTYQILEDIYLYVCAKREAKQSLKTIEIQLMTMHFPFWETKFNEGETPLYFANLLMMMGLSGYKNHTVALGFDSMFTEFSRLMEPAFLNMADHTNASNF